MPKKETLKPAILHTRDAMEAEATEYLRAWQRIAEIKARDAQRKLEIDKASETEINELVQANERRFASIQNFCELNRKELLPGDRKSFETATAVIKFYTTPHAVDKVRSKEPWGAIAKRLLGLVFKRKGANNEEVAVDCSQFVREADPEVNKDSLLARRSEFSDEELRIMGIQFTQEEHFSIAPKDKSAEPVTAVAK